MVATRTYTSLPAPIDATVFCNAIKQKLIDLSYTVVDDYVSGSVRYIICSYVFDVAKTYGTIFLKFAFSGLSVTQTLGTGYTVATKSFHGGGTESFGQGYQSGVNIDLITYSNGNQYRLVFVSQGTESYYSSFIGFMRPANKPAWWNEDSAPFAFINRNTDPYISPWYTAGIRPFSAVSEVTPVLFSGLSNPNPITLERDMINNIPLMINGRYGIAGSLPEDFFAVSTYGINKLDTIVIGAERYEVVFSFASNASGYAIRIQ